MRVLAAAAALLATLPGCAPAFEGAPSLVEGPRLLGIIVEPAEVAPGMEISLRALVMGRDGVDALAAPEWALCTAPKGPAEDNVVATECLSAASLRPIGRGARVLGAVPLDACSLFGPETPPQPAGRPPLRPRDADATGGYYQPVRADLAPLPSSFGLVRVTCGVAGATQEVAAAYRARYRANRNPTLVALSARVEGMEVPFDRLPASGEVTLSARLADDARETFVQLDATGLALIDRLEALQLSWFATAGRFAADRTGPGEGEATSDNLWRAGGSVGVVHFAVVVRDSRGGSGTLTLDGQIAP